MQSSAIDSREAAGLNIPGAPRRSHTPSPHNPPEGDAPSTARDLAPTALGFRIRRVDGLPPVEPGGHKAKYVPGVGGGPPTVLCTLPGRVNEPIETGRIGNVHVEVGRDAKLVCHRDPAVYFELADRWPNKGWHRVAYVPPHAAPGREAGWYRLDPVTGAPVGGPCTRAKYFAVIEGGEYANGLTT